MRVLGYGIDKRLAEGAGVGTVGGRVEGIEGVEAVEALFDDPAVVASVDDDVDLLEEVLPDVGKP